MAHTLRISVIAFVAAAVISLTGCSAGDAPKPGDTQKEKEHTHEPGKHGGIIVEVGRDNYHVEAVFETSGRLLLYTLGKNEAKIQEVELQDLTGHARAKGDNASVEFTLKPAPQPGDTGGKTSRFIGKLPESVVGKQVEVTINGLKIGTDRFRIAFSSGDGGHGKGHAPEMPPGVGTEEEKQLFLTPGGIYTAASIQANGNQVPSQKFKGFKAKHNRDPKVGDKICPVTETLANPECTWVVAGKTYEFCCPPCVTEFVTWAKTEPDKIKEPGEYVKK